MYIDLYGIMQLNFIIVTLIHSMLSYQLQFAIKKNVFNLPVAMDHRGLVIHTMK